jgi:hypothetical protein
MKHAALLLVAIAATACGGSAGSGSGASTPSSVPPSSLRIEIQPGFIANAKATSYTLTCNPAGGTVPHPAAACSALAADPTLLAPGAPCGAGMPDVGSKAVTGTWQGRRVALQYRGCEGDGPRWVKMAAALGITG